MQKKLLPESIRQTLYIVAERVRSYDTDQDYQYRAKLSSFNPEVGPNHLGYILLGTTEVAVDVPPCNPLQAEVAAMEKERTRILAEAHIQANRISERIQQLLCITHDEG